MAGRPKSRGKADALIAAAAEAALKGPGADAVPAWRKKRVVDPCAKCGTELQGEPIPKKDQHLYKATHFSRVIGNYSRELDRTVSWQCPDCGHTWQR